MPTLSNQTLLVYRLTCSLLIEAINNIVSFASWKVVVDGTRNFRSGSVIIFLPGMNRRKYPFRYWIRPRTNASYK